MPIPLLIPLALGAAQAIPKVAAAISQKRKANRLQLQSTVPKAFTEQLAGLRLGANTARLPGMGAAENRLAQNFAGGAQASLRSGASGADALAGISALSLQRQQGQSQLGIQGQQYQDAAKNRLNGGLSQLAAYQMKDQDDYSRNKANFVNGSNQNLNNAVNGMASFAALGLDGLGGGDGGVAGLGGTDALAGGALPALQGLPNLGLPGRLPAYTGNGSSNPYATGLGNYGAVRRRQRGIGL